MSSPLYGRDYEFAWLQTRMLRVAEQLTVPSLTFLHGGAGVGKTALLEQFYEQALMREERATLLLRSCPLAGMAGVDSFARSLLSSVVVRPSAWAAQLAQLGHDYNGAVAQLRRDQGDASVAYSPSGQLPAADSLAGDPSGRELAELLVRLLRDFYVRWQSVSGVEPSAVRCIISLDQFSHYAPSVKRWFGGVFMVAYLNSSQVPIPQLVLTDREAWGGGGQSDYFEFPLGRIQTCQLTALGRSSCMKWLVAERIKPELIDDVMEWTDGVPGRILELLADRSQLQQLEKKLREESNGSAVVTARQRRWLHAAALLDVVDSEGLMLLLGGGEGREAFVWFTVQQPEGVRVVGEGEQRQVKLSSSLRARVLEESSRLFPALHGNLKKKNLLQKRLLEKVPQSSHREYLRRLVPIEPFDFEMIDQIYGNE